MEITMKVEVSDSNLSDCSMKCGYLLTDLGEDVKTMYCKLFKDAIYLNGPEKPYRCDWCRKLFEVPKVEVNVPEEDLCSMFWDNPLVKVLGDFATEELAEAIIETAVWCVEDGMIKKTSVLEIQRRLITRVSSDFHPTEDKDCRDRFDVAEKILHKCILEIVKKIEGVKA